MTLFSDAYLPDPGDGQVHYLNPRVSTFEQLCEGTCNVLLGEPGMGKSMSLRQDHEQLAAVWASQNETHALIDLGLIDGLVALKSTLTQDSRVRDWLNGQGILHLSLDSLDEALSAYSQLPKALASELHGFDKKRLRLVIACRDGDWPPYLETELAALYGQTSVSVWHIAPLRQEDVTIAAKASIPDANQFLREVSEKNLEPLAARPITLDFLIRRYSSASRLPDDVSVLYEEGCKQLVCERPDSSRFTQPQRIDASQKLAVAGRIACAGLFGARASIDAAPAGSSEKGSAVLELKDLTGGVERAGGNPFVVGETEVSEVLRSGLFTASGLRFRWSHKSYAEFLAAYHLRVNSVSPRQMVSLIRCGGRVAPALRGVAAWLSVLCPDVFDELLRIDPAVLMLTDLSPATQQQKASLVEWLLKEAESESPLLHEWGFSWRYRRLKHSQLREQLAPILSSSRPESVRLCAIEIAHACGGLGFTSILSDLALCEAEPPFLRIWAASCVADHGTDHDKMRLAPPAFRASATDVEERLQVQALSAVWPAHATWAQVRDALGSRDYSPVGPLGRFVAHDVAESMPVSELAGALGWLAQKYSNPDTLSAWATAGDKILVRAMSHVEDPLVCRAVADLLYARVASHFQMFSRSGRRQVHELGPRDSRRLVAAQLIPRLTPNPWLVQQLVASSMPLLIREDIEFAIEKWEAAPSAEKPAWAQAVWCLTGDIMDGLRVLRRVRSLPVLRRTLLEGVLRVRHNAKLEKQGQLERETQESQRTAEQISRLHDLLRVSEGDARRFWELTLVMRVPLGEPCATHADLPDIRSLPGWSVFDEQERKRLIAAGKRFLDKGTAYTFLDVRPGQPTRTADAAYMILRDLVVLEPDYARSLPEATWHKWAPSIVVAYSFMTRSERQDVDHQLLTLACAKAQDGVVRTVRALFRTGRVLLLEDTLDTLAGVAWSPALEEAVSDGTSHPTVRGQLHLEGLRVLFVRAHERARQLVQAGIATLSSASEADASRVARGAAVWLERDRHEAWPTVLAPLRANPSFLRPLLGVRDLNGQRVAKPEDWLPDDQLGELFRWLRAEFGGPTLVPGAVDESVSNFQASILAALKERRSGTALTVLKRLEQDFPADWYLRSIVWEAEGLLLESTWQPLAPVVVRRMVEDRRQTLVRDEGELLEAVLEALHEFEESLRGAGDRVLRLWNERYVGSHLAYQPKPEEPMSREISLGLSDLLNSRGVSSSLEVKIRTSQHVDIQVSAVTSGSPPRTVSLIIEAKGCWHKDAKTSLETQLAGRYLSENRQACGVYLVVWCLCDKWDGRDPRKSRAQWQSPQDARAFLEAQAARVNLANGTHIRTFVLDATLSSSEHKRRAKRSARSPAKTVSRKPKP